MLCYSHFTKKLQRVSEICFFVGDGTAQSVSVA